LENYDVTLHDCNFYKPNENHTDDGYNSGTNLIKFYSEETFGYCDLIHKFKIDGKIGLSIFNDFEFISETGDKNCI
jgi:hypothetical protein